MPSPSSSAPGAWPVALLTLLMLKLTSYLPSAVVRPALRSATGRRMIGRSLFEHGDRITAGEFIGDTMALRNGSAFFPTLGAGVRYEFDSPVQVPTTIAWGTRDRILLYGQSADDPTLIIRVIDPDGPGHVAGPPGVDRGVKIFDSVVIGAGQAGLSSSFHLLKRGLDHVVLDSGAAPGGAWQHRWRSLTMSDVHGVAGLPGLDVPAGSDDAEARAFVPAYFGDYEHPNDLPIIRPVHVYHVRDDGGLLVVQADGRAWTTRTLINATGTWTHPFVPHYPGMETAPVAEGTTWVTRRPPVWRTSGFDREAGRAAVALVEERVRQGLPPRSVVSVTGLALREQERAAQELGAYERREMFAAVEPDGVRWADGDFQRADVILWATGFRPAIDHLAPLHLRGSRGGIQLDGTTAVVDPRIQLVGYGPSASTIGANRAGRVAALGVSRRLRTVEPAAPTPSPTPAH